jgi:hypothetical protein
MAYEADKVVVELIAQNDQFDAATKASAANFQQSMSGIQASGTAAEKGVGQFSSALKENRLAMNQSRIGMMEFQHIARGVSDQIAAGAPLTQVLTQHVGMLGEAVALSGGAFGRFGAFLMGPWGVALTLATVAGSKLLQHFLTEKDTLESVYEKLLKHKEQTELSARADDIWAHSIDGLIERSEKLGASLDKRLQTQTDLQKSTLSQAQTDFAAAMSAAARIENDPNATKKQVESAQKAIRDTSIALHNAQVAAGQDAGVAIASITEAARVWADEQLHAIEVIQTAHPELAEKQVADEMLAAYDTLKDAIDDAASANVNFNDTVGQTNKLNHELLTGAIGVTTYDQKIRALAESLHNLAEEAKNAPHAIEQFKQSVMGAEGTGANRMGSSAAGFGQFMPKTWESYFRQLYPQQAAGMSTSAIDDLRNNKTIAAAVIDKATDDYVEVLKRAGQSITAASLYTVHLLGAGDARKLLAAAPDTPTSGFLSASVLRGNPFLAGTAGSARAAIAKRIGDSSGAVSSGAAALVQMQEQAAKKAAEQEAAFTTEMDRLNGELISARKEQTKDELALLDYQEDQVRAEEKKRDDSYASSVATGKLTQAQADELTAVSASVAAEKLKALEIQRQAEVAKRQHDLDDQSYQVAEGNLRAEDQAATSQAQHRELQLAILDIVYQQKLADLEYLKLQAERNGQLGQANLIQRQIDNLPAEKHADRASTLRGTMDPLEAWLQSIPHDAQAVTEALQGIATNGFDQIASAVAGVITGTQTLGQAFNNISRQIIGDIIQMTVRMLIFRAISSFLGSLGGIPSPDLAMPSQVDLGVASPVFVNSPIGDALAGLPTLAGGGFGVIGGNGGTDNNLLSLNGRGIAWVSNGEGLAITPSNASAAALGSGGSSIIIVKVEPNDDRFDAYVESIAGPLAVQAGTNAAFGGAALARNNLARRQLHQLGSRG